MNLATVSRAADSHKNVSDVSIVGLRQQNIGNMSLLTAPVRVTSGEADVVRICACLRKFL